jgi:hypothetical protein
MFYTPNPHDFDGRFWWAFPLYVHSNYHDDWTMYCMGCEL